MEALGNGVLDCQSDAPEPGIHRPERHARAAVVGSLSAQQLAGLPAGLLQAKGSDLFTPGHFDALWSAMKGGICNDVQQAIQTLENHSPNSPYNIQPCAMNPKGYLTANFQESSEDDSMNMVNGRRIRFTYQAPLNGVTSG